jgi:group I intron endonuclease
MKKVIYKIENNINDKIYIGSTENFKLRYNQHKHHLLKGTHHSRILQNFVNKYGFNCLSFKIIEENVINLIEREQFYIDTLNPFFNIRKIADSMKDTKRTESQKKYMVEQRMIKSPYKKGWKHSKETLEKISNNRKGIKQSQETKIKIGIANKGRLVSSETKIKISKSTKGKVINESTKIKLSEQKKGILNPMYGKSKNLHHNFGKKWICSKKKKSKKIIDTNTGIIYESVKIASEELNIPLSSFYKYILGYTESVKNFKYYE